MKRKLFVIASITLFACSSPKTKIDSNIAEWIKQYAHNPDSYEPISTKLIDTTTEVENLIYLIKSKIFVVHLDSSGIQYQKEFINSDSSTLSKARLDYQKELKSDAKNFATSGFHYSEHPGSAFLNLIEMDEKKLDQDKKEIIEKKKEIQKDKEELKKLESKLDSIKKSPNPNSIYAYHFIHQCRIRVPLGGLMLKTIVFETDKNLNIINGSETQ